MTSYAESWAPQTIEQAEFLIDTRRAGDEFWDVGRDLARFVMTYAPAHTATVCEYGCGVGRIIGEIDAPVTVGIDVSAEMLGFARERFPHTLFRQTDGASIPLDDGSIDFVYSILALQHMDARDVTGVLYDVSRVLAEDGRCYLRFSGFGVAWMDNRTLPRGPLVWNGGRQGSSTPAHTTIAYDPDLIARLADENGLRVFDIETVDDGQLDHALIGGRR